MLVSTINWQEFETLGPIYLTFIYYKTFEPQS